MSSVLSTMQCIPELQVLLFLCVTFVFWAFLRFISSVLIFWRKIKIWPKYDRNTVKIRLKYGRNTFKIRLKYGPNTAKIRLKYGRNTAKIRNTSELRPKYGQNMSKIRPKYCWSMAEIWLKYGLLNCDKKHSTIISHNSQI